MADKGSAFASRGKLHQSVPPPLPFRDPISIDESEGKDLLSFAVKDAVWHAFGAVYIEVWILSSDGLRIRRPASGHWMDPVFIQSVPDPVLAHEVNNNAPECAPGESLAGTLFAETSRFGTNNRNKVHWREIKSMMDDPFIEQGRDKRMKQLYGLGIGIVATVPFRCQRTDGIVLFMSRTTVDTDMLISEKNEKYLLGAVDLIRASISIQEARDERSWMKQSTRQVAIDKLKSSLLKPSGRSNFAKSIRTSSQMRISQPSISYQERRQSIQEVVSMSEAGKEQRGRVLALTTELTRSLKNSIRKWRGGGLKAPPRQDLEESLIAWVGVFSTMLALTCFDHPNDPRSVYDAAWFSGTLCIVFSLTAAPVGQPIQIVLSHLWNSLIGLAFRYAPLPMLVKQSMSTAFGVSGMAILGIMHPPSTSLAYTFASKSDIDYISLVWVLICDMVLIGLAVVYLNLFERKQYPTFWTGRGEKLSWKYLTRQKQVDGGWCCGRKANPSDTGEVDPPQIPSTKDEKV